MLGAKTHNVPMCMQYRVMPFFFCLFVFFLLLLLLFFFFPAAVFMPLLVR